MSWLRIDDRLTMSLKIRGLHDDGVTGPRRTDQRNASLGHWLLILTWIAGERTDGFVTEDIVEQFGTPATTQRLTRARYGRAPLLHEIGADGTPPRCPCVDGRWWPPGFRYLIHDYLDTNPSRSENDVHRAKRRELRDAKLKRAVRDRDLDRCRYCARACRPSDRVSDAGLDHVDPEVANGADNLVVACRGCNNRKNRRTPEQADMELMPASAAAPTPGPGTVAGPDLKPTSAGRDGAGSVAGPSMAVGPPDTFRGPRSSSPYSRPERHAGVPSHLHTHGTEEGS